MRTGYAQLSGCELTLRSMFPTRDALDAAGTVLQRDQIRRALQLEGTLVEHEDRPVLTLPHPAGGQIVIAKMRREHLVRWVLMVPASPEPTLHEPSSLEEYPRLIGEALGIGEPR